MPKVLREREGKIYRVEAAEPGLACCICGGAADAWVRVQTAPDRIMVGVLYCIPDATDVIARLDNDGYRLDKVVAPR